MSAFLEQEAKAASERGPNSSGWGWGRLARKDPPNRDVHVHRVTEA